jgi:hypothetical protein
MLWLSIQFDNGVGLGSKAEEERFEQLSRGGDGAGITSNAVSRWSRVTQEPAALAPGRGASCSLSWR